MFKNWGINLSFIHKSEIPVCGGEELDWDTQDINFKKKLPFITEIRNSFKKGAHLYEISLPPTRI